MSWKAIAIIFIIGFVVSVGFLDFRSYQVIRLKEEINQLQKNYEDPFGPSMQSYGKGDLRFSEGLESWAWWSSEWIRINISSNKNETIYMHYGNQYESNATGRFKFIKKKGEECYIYVGDYSELPERFFILNNDETIEIERCKEDKTAQ